MYHRRNPEKGLFKPDSQRSSSSTVRFNAGERRIFRAGGSMRRHIETKNSQTDSTTTQKTPAELRFLLQWVSGANASLSLSLSSLAYWDVQGTSHSSADDYTRGAICLVSCMQAALVGIYSALWLLYMERKRTILRLSGIPVPTLCKSYRALAACGLECGFHLIVLLPRVSFQLRIYQKDTNSLISLNDFLYVLVFMRNYHLLQFLFWCSPFSTTRTNFITHLSGVRFTKSFLLRCYLAYFSLKLVLGMYVAILILSGICIFIFEKGSEQGDFHHVENGLWIAALTQSTIGFGDFFPTTYFGQTLTIASCFIGIFVISVIISLTGRVMSLGLAECSLYSEMAYARKKRTYVYRAAVVIQRWWKLMDMRIHKRMNAATIGNFYRELRRYRNTIAACQRQKDRSFERQIEAFQSSFSTNFRRMNEYFQPIISSEALVSPI